MKSGIWNYNAANSDFRSLSLGATLYNGAEPIQIIIYLRRMYRSGGWGSGAIVTLMDNLNFWF